MPALVRVDKRQPIKMGKFIRIQEQENGKWESVLVTYVDDSGYFRADRM